MVLKLKVVIGEFLKMLIDNLIKVAGLGCALIGGFTIPSNLVVGLTLGLIGFCLIYYSKTQK